MTQKNFQTDCFIIYNNFSPYLTKDSIYPDLNYTIQILLLKSGQNGKLFSQIFFFQMSHFFLNLFKALLRQNFLIPNRIYYQYFKETDIEMEYICYYIAYYISV